MERSQMFLIFFCSYSDRMMAARTNLLAAAPSNNKVKYSRLAADDDGYIDLQVRTIILEFLQGLTLIFSPEKKSSESSGLIHTNDEWTNIELVLYIYKKKFLVSCG